MHTGGDGAVNGEYMVLDGGICMVVGGGVLGVDGCCVRGGCMWSVGVAPALSGGGQTPPPLPLSQPRDGCCSTHCHMVPLLFSPTKALGPAGAGSPTLAGPRRSDKTSFLFFIHTQTEQA
jgi:hypothetical protein